MRKMKAEMVDGLAHYQLDLGGEKLDLNGQLGKHLSLRFTGGIFCLACGGKTNKSYGNGHCGRCFSTLASCDMCILKPELCHYEKGTCREPDWGQANCMIPHVVYLSNTGGAKVGITRHTQIPTRWIDQGAIAALPIFQVGSRYQSGLLERLLGQEVSDKTNWRKMLKGEVEAVDLPALRDHIFDALGEELDDFEDQFSGQVTCLEDEGVVSISYPVNIYPEKVKSLNFDKMPLIEGTLQGIKGQYLIFDNGVLNIRRAGGYAIELNIRE